MAEPKHPLAPLVEAWFGVIKRAQKYKNDNFQVAADECKRFLAGGTKLNEYMWGPAGVGKGGYVIDPNDIETSGPTYQFTTNKVAELLQLFAPTLYNRNPVRTCTPRKYDPIPAAIFGVLNPQLLMQSVAPEQPPPPPGSPPQAMQQFMAGEQAKQQAAQQLQMMTQQANQQDELDQVKDLTISQLFEEVLNYTPRALDLKGNSRLVIDECLLKGAGVWWCEMVETEDGRKLIGSFYESVDRYLCDPDGEKIDDCTWVARLCIHPQWMVEQEYGLAQNALDNARRADGSQPSGSTQTYTGDARSDAEKLKRGTTNDLVAYWKVYSKMGLGGRMANMAPEMKNLLDGFGDRVFLVLCDGVPYPLNLPSERLVEAPQVVDPQGTTEWLDGINQSLQWPIDFGHDGRGWPMTILAFHPQNNCIWPYSHVAIGLGELKWINWCLSFLAGKVKTSCTTIVALPKGLPEDEENKIKSGQDQRIVHIDMTLVPNGRIGDMISYVQQPEFHKDIYEVLTKVEDSLDKRWGVSELLYGKSGEATPRSATDVSVRQQNTSIRLDDMANLVQEAMGEIANKEAFAWWLLAEQQDVLPILGKPRADLWQKLVKAAPVEDILWKLDFRIESGSMAKPNTESKLQQLSSFAQHIMPVLQQAMSQFGEVGPLNAFLEDWAKAMGLDASRYMVQPPPPPPQPAPSPAAEGQPHAEAPPGQPGKQHGEHPADVRTAA
jgi:hypothetical protein